MNNEEKLLQFRDLAYETGWIAGMIEGGALFDEKTQREKIQERNRLQGELTGLLYELKDCKKAIQDLAGRIREGR